MVSKYVTDLLPKIGAENLSHQLFVYISEMLSGRSMPLLFISATPSVCERVRKDLNLNYKQRGLYYDLTSNDDTMKKITMLPEKMPDEVKNMLSVFYGETITELDNKLANELLVKSTPKPTALQAQEELKVSETQCGNFSIFLNITKILRENNFEGS